MMSPIQWVPGLNSEINHTHVHLVNCLICFHGVVLRHGEKLTFSTGRAIAQVVILRLLTAEAQFRAQVRSCGICGGQSGTGAGFLLVLRFPLPILIPPTAPHSSSSFGAGTISQLVADVQSGLSATQPQETKKKKTTFSTAGHWIGSVVRIRV
jgi:hypothetical protein